MCYDNLGIIYIFAQPVLALIVVGVNPVAQAKVVITVWCTVNFICQMIMLLLFHPTYFPRHFPFHNYMTELSQGPVNPIEEAGRPMAFSGGTMALVDELGKFRALNSFDKIHISRLKDVAKTFEAELEGISSFGLKFQVNYILIRLISLKCLHYLNILLPQQLLDKISGDNLMDERQQGLADDTGLLWAKAGSGESSSGRAGRKGRHSYDDDDDDDDDQNFSGASFRRGGRICHFLFTLNLFHIYVLIF